MNRELLVLLTPGRARSGSRGSVAGLRRPHGRLVLVPSKYEPQDLFKDRPKVARVMSIDDMDRAIAQAVGAEDVPLR